MPKHAAEQSARSRRTLTALGMAGLIAGASLFIGAGAGSAAAGTALASKCTGTVSGKMGDVVKLKSDAVEEFVVKSVTGGFDFPLIPLTKSNQTKLRELFDAGKFDPISLTTVPNAPKGVLSDEKIAEAIVKKIEANDDGKQILGENDNRKSVLSAVETNCGDLTVKATNYVAPTTNSPSTPTNPQPGSGGYQPTPGSPGGSYQMPSISQDLLKYYGSGSARAPRRDYGGLPFTLPGMTGGLGGAQANPYSTPGTAADLGVLGDSTTSNADVNNAGNAEVVASPSPASQAIQLPMLLAVVSLAGVAAALVRTWVLRKL